jgi:hypothetical protein
MLSLTDSQLAIVMTAAGGLPVEKGGTFLERVAARLGLLINRFGRTPLAVSANPRFADSTRAKIDFVINLKTAKTLGLTVPLITCK